MIRDFLLKLFVPLIILVLIVLLADYLLYEWHGFEISDREVIYIFLGLSLNTIGALIVLAGDYKLFRQLFLPTDKINQLREAQSQLLNEEVLRSTDTGFHELCDVIERREGLENGVDRFELTTLRPSGVVATGATAVDVRPCIEKEDWSCNEYLEQLSEYQEPEEDPYQKYEPLDVLGSENLVSMWVEHEIYRIEQSSIQVPMKIGVLTLIMGFVLQMMGYIL